MKLLEILKILDFFSPKRSCRKILSKILLGTSASDGWPLNGTARRFAEHP